MSKPVAYVLNLDRRADRWKQMQESWSRYFDLKRIRAIDMPGRGAMGCKLSHVTCAEFLLRDESCVIILEDDATPLPAFEQIGLDCINEAWEWRKSWDYINLGPLLDLSKIGMPRADLSPSLSRLFLRTTYSHNTSAVLYNKRSLPLLQASLDDPVPIDMYLGRNSVDQWTPIRLLSKQTDSESDIRKKFPGQNSWYADTEKMLFDYETRNSAV